MNTFSVHDPAHSRGPDLAPATVSAIQDELAAMPLLTAPEKVLVKDVWNKFLAFQDMLVELFFERLLHENPDLADRLGDSVDLVPGYFAQLFDQSVRQLIPQTERILRESYRGVYPSQPAHHQPIDQQIALLTDLGMRPVHWISARRVWMWTIAQVPHLEDYDRDNIARGNESAFYRFFSLHLLPTAFDVDRAYASMLTPDMVQVMRKSCEIMAANALSTGTEFYQELFQTQPDLLPYFGRTDVDGLAEHLMHTLVFLTRSLEAGRDVATELRDLGRTHLRAGIPPEAYPKLVAPMLAVMKRHLPNFSAEQEQAWSMLLIRVSHVLQQPMISVQRLLASAREFIDQLAAELEWTQADRIRRWGEVEREIRATGTYTQTYDELSYGAQLAWRNATKCIGRISWRNMLVRDMRHVNDPDAMFRECVEHMRLATNGGIIQTVMTVFRPKKPAERWGPRIWNSQYVRFAAYEQPDGSILGDPANLKLTQAIVRQGWTPPADKTAFDYLPLVIDVPGQQPRLYSFQPDDVLRVTLEHPQYPAFDALNLQWCAVPAITNFRLDIGGVQYGCVPFNGWFMETEIARNLWEEGRYNLAEPIARSFNLDTSSALWHDRAFLELNAAVLHSFTKARVTLVDHQTAARQFMTHDQREKRAGRECPAQWSWVVPSAGGSTTPVWHHEMRDFYLNPSFHYAADRWSVIDDQYVMADDHVMASTPVAQRLLILYGSETGTSESYAHQTARRLSRYHPRVMALDEYDLTQLPQEQWLLIISSTFRKGELPANAQRFYTQIRQLPDGALSKLHFAVLALGNTVYPHFCAAGIMLDQQLARLGANRAAALHKADEINGQAATFRQWLGLVARLLGEDPSRSTEEQTSRADWKLQVSFVDAEHVDSAETDKRLHRHPGVDVPVITNRELLKEVIVGSRSTRFIAFDISETGLTYETGDHVVIYPHNPPELVERICRQINVDADAYFYTSLTTPEGADVLGDHTYPAPVRVGDVLIKDLDLSLREPYDELVDALLAAAQNPAERAMLASWSELLNRDEYDADGQALKKHMADAFMSVCDLLDAFPSAPLTFGQLIELLPRQRPRLYSISSCSLVYPTEIHVTVGVVQITTDEGYTRPGLCSNYLARLTTGDHVRLSVRTSNFRPPRDPQAPMLMVGPGTGLSPLVGFLQHREVQLRMLRQAQQSASGHTLSDAPSATLKYPGSPLLKARNGRPKTGWSSARPGETRLFFGCRNLNDYLYQQELETWHEEGILTHLDVAFSRLGEDRIYVQDLMGRQGAAIWEVLSQPDCHYYVCGDAKMADDVFAVLLNVARTYGGLSATEAVEFFRTMQHENRFFMDVWGVLLNFKQSMAEVQAAKYTQGERWLMDRIG
ncbi:nitric oxide synthase oxygenase [Spirosoma sordidisoli]|uniref:nitric oxide dioxygenase n=1 Tax=Spirosoma sordidisoli TaxID=2502893 RepID=A0A4V1RVV4_9BACT|nr:nitric oxide synthase oxygenase [Spirosoma sordidisoli]RYC68078.1 nitric-oxide synthase [Spirosoma sordidisoli]